MIVSCCTLGVSKSRLRYIRAFGYMPNLNLAVLVTSAHLCHTLKAGHILKESTEFGTSGHTPSEPLQERFTAPCHLIQERAFCLPCLWTLSGICAVPNVLLRLAVTWVQRWDTERKGSLADSRAG